MNKHIHVMGIGGSGASGAASIASEVGFIVSGCDLSLSSEYVAQIPSLVHKQKGHSPVHLRGVDMLVISPAVTSLDPQNPEILQAHARKIPLFTWPAFVGSVLMKDKRVVAVCGTHGKSTTTALVGLMLEQAGISPTVLLGAIVPKWNRNYRVGTSDLFVIEADEYNESFLAYHPEIIVLTNLEYDHPEFFSSFDTMIVSFTRFVGNLKKGGTVILDPQNTGINRLRTLLKKRYRSTTLQEVGANEQTLVQEAVKLPGEFNQRNAALALAAASQVGVSPKEAKQALQDFHGVRRRFELVGTVDSIAVYDDYAHHPTAIAKTMQAARECFLGKCLWVLWEPHMFTRTKTFFKEFVQTFKEGAYDRAVIVDIYPAREQDPGDVSSRQLVAAIGDSRVEYKDNSTAAEYISANVQKGDVVLCMGAGMSSKLSHTMFARIKKYHG